MLLKYDIRQSTPLTTDEGSGDPFLFIRYDDKRGDLRISSASFGTAYPVYLTEENGVVYISDSLMCLREASGKEFHLNIEALKLFFINGFVPGKDTLIKDVYKLPPRCNLLIRDGECFFENTDLFLRHQDVGSIQADAVSMAYDIAMLNALRRSLPNEETINLALSGGFDTNLLLCLIKKTYPEVKLNCFSVGGTIGKDETHVAASIAKTYDNVSFFRSLVSQETMDHFDDIVFRLQGSVYQMGIFLQYELAKMLHEHKCGHLICGECADQVFNQLSYRTIEERRTEYSFDNTPFEMASYVVLPKSAIMLRSFGIKGIYPYLDNDVVGIGKLTRFENGNIKAYHKKQCKRHIPAKVFNQLEKTAGKTSLEALMDTKTDYEMLCKSAAYYDADLWFEMARKGRSAMDYYLSLRFIESFERQFCGDGSKRR